MELWIIEPYDPLIVRDGRPFGPDPGARARSLDFPFPSTVAGGLRTRAGQSKNGYFDAGRIPVVKQVGLRGPLLVELDDHDIRNWLAPAPGDALLLREHDQATVYRHWLQPLATNGDFSDLPDGLAYPVGLVQPDLKKSYKDAPHYWYWDRLVAWLANPPGAPEIVDAAALGHNGPGKDWRVHVAIASDSLTGIDGALFATSGLEFWQQPSSTQKRLSQVRRLALAAEAANLDDLTIAAGFAPLGGERRTMRWQRSKTAMPSMPEGLAEAIAQTGDCRLILLTPACFDEGWRPSWLLQPRHGVAPTLQAAVVGKPQTVSGWDFEKKPGKDEQAGPKPTRRLVPAGSVYFLQLGKDAASIRQWVEAMWLANVSDVEEDRLTGFGLAAIGVWSGQAKQVKVEHA